MKINTTETWLSLLEAQIEKKAKKELEKKEEYSNEIFQLSSQVKKLEMENSLLQERIKNFQANEMALEKIQEMAGAFHSLLTPLIKNQEKNHSFQKQLERMEEKIALLSTTPNVLSQMENEYVTKAVFAEELDLIRKKLSEKIQYLEKRIERESNLEKRSAEKNGVRRRITTDTKSSE